MECEEERQRAIQEVREVVETAFDKMSAAPELNPGDWKWIECISLYIDSHWHRGESDRERERRDLEWANKWDEDEEKEHWGERKRAAVCYQLTTGAFQTPSSSPIIPLLRLRVLFSPRHTTFWYSANPAGCPAECPAISLCHQHQEMDTIGRARLIPGWWKAKGHRVPRG